MCYPSKANCRGGPFHGPIHDQADLARYAFDHPNTRDDQGRTAADQFQDTIDRQTSFQPMMDFTTLDGSTWVKEKVDG